MLQLPDGSTLGYRMTRVGNRLLGASDDVPGIDVALGPSGSGSVAVVLEARLDSGAELAAAGRYAGRMSGESSRITYADTAAGDCMQQPQQNSEFASFAIGATILSLCTVSHGRLDFGTILALDNPVDAQTVVTVQCTKGTRYSIALEGGVGGGAEPSRRRLVSGPDVLTYAIYRDAGRLLPWGTTAGLNTVSGVGTGLPEALRIFGRIHAHEAPAPGRYSDSLLISVRY